MVASVRSLARPDNDIARLTDNVTARTAAVGATTPKYAAVAGEERPASR